MRTGVVTRISWIRRHLARQPTTSAVHVPPAAVVAKINESVAFAPLSADRDTRARLHKTGFVTGALHPDGGGTEYRLRAWRPGTWGGRSGAAFGSADRISAKPVLVVDIAGSGPWSTLTHRIDAFNTAVSFLVFAALAICLFVAGGIVALTTGPPIRIIGYLLLGLGVFLLVLASRIFLDVEDGMLDEEFLDGWLTWLGNQFT